jgi:MFS family permease
MARCEPTPDSLRSWCVAVIGVVMGALSFGAVTSIPILLKPLSLHWNTGASTIALVHTSAMFGAAFGGLVMGRMLGRFGFFRIATFGALATCVGLVCAAEAETLGTMHLVYGLLIGGIGQGAFFSPLMVAVSQWFSRQRAVAIAVVACGQSVGGLVLPPVMRWGVEQIGWQTLLTCYGLVAGALLITCAFAFRRSPPEEAPQHVLPETLEMKGSEYSRAMLMLGAGMALSNNASFIVIAHLTAFSEERGFAPTAAAAGVSAMLGVSLLSRLSVGQLSARLGSYRVLVAMSVVLAIGIVSLALAKGAVSIGVAAVVMGLAFGGYLPGYAILVREVFPAAQAGRRIGEMFFFAFVAAGVGSWTGGWARDLTGAYTVPFWVAAASAIAGAATLLAFRKSVRGRTI